jgi:dihydrofolate reductase
MEIALIAAHGQNREIGYENKLLWHISADLKRFKKITSGHTVIMGRLTFESINSKPLPNRRNIVLTRKRMPDQVGVEYASTKEEAIEKIGDEELVFILGGSQIYKLFLPMADWLYLTIVHSKYKADRYFPDYDIYSWKVIERTDVMDDISVDVEYSFITLQRIR